MKRDIVYVIKNDASADELRYSLRSVCKNFEHRNIVIYGGCPKGIKPNLHVMINQTGSTKYAKTRGMFKTIFENNKLSKEIWLFNDDFFIMEPYNQEVPITNGTIKQQIVRIRRRRYGAETAYTRRLQRTIDILRRMELDAISYECHVPFLIDREKGLEILRKFSDEAAFRSAYGNYYSIGGVLQEDSKINDIDIEPPHDAKILSSGDRSFKDGLIGEYVRASFPDKCGYEL